MCKPLHNPAGGGLFTCVPASAAPCPQTLCSALVAAVIIMMRLLLGAVYKPAPRAAGGTLQPDCCHHHAHNTLFKF
jgi:hypothetical protein